MSPERYSHPAQNSPDTLDGVDQEMRDAYQKYHLNGLTLHAQKFDPLFSMSEDYETEINRRFLEAKKELGITERRGSREYYEHMQEIEEDFGFYPYFTNWLNPKPSEFVDENSLEGVFYLTDNTTR